jgi:sugar fermentation stimulation protein A
MQGVNGRGGPLKFTETVHEGVFLKRYKRFFADIEMGGKVHTAHVPNTGSLKSCLEEGAACLVTESSNPNRKLRYTLQMIRPQGQWVGVNTQLTNELAFEAFNQKLISHWSDFKICKREYKINPRSRIDFAMQMLDSENHHFVEVKNVTFLENECAKFPDAVTERGQKHLEELVKLIENGQTAELLFVIQREGCTSLAPADEIDPRYGQLLRWAHQKGVRITAKGCRLSPQEIKLDSDVEIIL